MTPRILLGLVAAVLLAGCASNRAAEEKATRDRLETSHDEAQRRFDDAEREQERK